MLRSLHEALKVAPTCYMNIAMHVVRVIQRMVNACAPPNEKSALPPPPFPHNALHFYPRRPQKPTLPTDHSRLMTCTIPLTANALRLGPNTLDAPQSPVESFEGRQHRVHTMQCISTHTPFSSIPDGCRRRRRRIAASLLGLFRMSFPFPLSCCAASLLLCVAPCHSSHSTCHMFPWCLPAAPCSTKSTR